MDAIGILKGAVGMAASVGIGTIVENAIKATTPETIKTMNKVLVGFGSLVLAGALGGIATKYTDEVIDNGVDTFKSVLKMVKPEEVTDI